MPDLNKGKPTSKVLQNLERLYKTAIDEEKPFAFYKALEAYFEAVLKEPTLKKVVDQQIKERNDIYEKIDEIEVKAQKEMRLAKDKLLSFIKKNSVNTANFFRLNTMALPPFTDIALELEAYERKEIRSSKSESNYLEVFLFDISANLLKLGHKEAVKDFLVSDKEYSSYYSKINGTGGYFLSNENGNFIFSPIWPERFVQENLLENERAFKSWGAFELLLKFHYAFSLVARNVNFWSLSEDLIPEPLRRIEDFTDIALMVEDLYFLGGQTHANSPRKYMSPNRSHELDRLNSPVFKSTLQAVHNIFVQKIENEDTPEEKNIENEKIKEITFVKKKTQPKPTYDFYINGNLDEIKPLRSDSARLRKLIEIAEENDLAFDKDLLDYVNSNSNCAIYCSGKYGLTKILEKHGNYFKIHYGIKVKVIGEIEYRKKLNKKNRA